MLSAKIKQNSLLKKIAFILVSIGTLLVFYDLGFEKSKEIQDNIYYIYLAISVLEISTIVGKFIKAESAPPFKIIIFEVLSLAFFMFVLFAYDSDNANSETWLSWHVWAHLSVFLAFIREFSTLKLAFGGAKFNPALLLILSFIAVIFTGGFLLMLPNATQNGISFTDAVFTSGSAVCVTGLIVVDTSTYYTQFGQIIILALIQIGGLGIMTFAVYFAYFFQGSISYSNQLTMNDLTNSEKLGTVFDTIKQILFITLLIEGIGAFIVYQFISNDAESCRAGGIFFSVFHSVSSFCNAGFSTLKNNLYESTVRNNYPFQFSIASLFILGGLGFPIIYNVFELTKYQIKILFNRLILSGKKNMPKHRPWVLSINSRIVITMTAVLLLGGTVLILIAEYNNTLAEHNLIGKIVTAFFTAATPRTAGFNSVDMTALGLPAVMITFFLMWIGASPASTGGGIKTTTLAVAILNVTSLAKGKERIEIFRREIASATVRRAFAVIFLSLVVLSLGVLLLTFTDPDKSVQNLAFESVSAYSTVGLSLGITANLSIAGKWIIIALMFLGRVSTLSMLIALLPKERLRKYKYPTEEIMIN